MFQTMVQMVQTMVQNGVQNGSNIKTRSGFHVFLRSAEIAQDGWFIDFLRAVQAVERGSGKVEVGPSGSQWSRLANMAFVHPLNERIIKDLRGKDREDLKAFDLLEFSRVAR